MPLFKHDGLEFYYQENGEGIPFIFQHGLGGDVSQPFGLFSPPSGIRLLAFDCRAHGQTRPLGNIERIHLSIFADDLGVFMDHLGINSAVIGGTSMGAAITLNFTLRFPDRVLGLVQSRAAWLDSPNEQNARVFAEMARLIRQMGPEAGLEQFKLSENYLEIERQSMESAKSLEGQFAHPRAAETVVKLEQIPLDAPCSSRQEWKKIRVPTLILANHQDPIHPFEFGKVLAESIPGAEFRELTSKAVDVKRHGEDVQKFLNEFFAVYFLPKELKHA
ncbi:MAG: alpha/beta hydrolase [Terriglobia bacterium]